MLVLICGPRTLTLHLGQVLVVFAEGSMGPEDLGDDFDLLASSAHELTLLLQEPFDAQ